MPSDRPALDVRDLSVSVGLVDGRRGEVVSGVSFAVARGGTLGLVGESGSGKTMTGLAIMGLLPPAARVEAGQVLLEGEDLLGKSDRELRGLRGRRLAMVLQDPMAALDPSFTVRNQLSQPLRRHRGLRGDRLSRGVVAALEQVGLSATGRRLRQFPHELSGGMSQRVVSAIALAGEPRVLIADEPVSALDADMQLRYLRLLESLQDAHDFALLLVEHDLNVVRTVCQRVCVMYAGQIVEEGPVAEVFAAPLHPYTSAMLGAVPELDGLAAGRWLASIDGQAPTAASAPTGCRFAPRCRFAREQCRTEPPLRERGTARAARCWGTEPDGGWIDPAQLARPDVGPARSAPASGNGPRSGLPAGQGAGSQGSGSDRPLVELTAVTKRYPSRRLAGGAVDIVAVDGVSLSIESGETLGLVGGTGSGKSTLANMIMGLTRPTSGSVVIAGHDVNQVTGPALRELQKLRQIVLQNPYSSLDMRKRVDAIVAEPLTHGRPFLGRARREQVAARVGELMTLVGLSADRVRQYPLQFSGGQVQRISIARALASEPQLVVLDEPTSALDVSVRAQVLNLLRRLQEALGVSYLVISHDLVTVAYLASRVGVMYQGRLVEIGPTASLFQQPRHPYTLELLRSVPDRAGRFRDAAEPPVDSTVDAAACRYAATCGLRAKLGNPQRCVAEDPALVEVGPGHSAACHFAGGGPS